MYRKENETSLGCVVKVISVEFEETTFPVNFLTVGDDRILVKSYSSEISVLFPIMSPETKGTSFVEIISTSPWMLLLAVKEETLFVDTVFSDVDLEVCMFAMFIISVAEALVLFVRSLFMTKELFVIVGPEPFLVILILCKFEKVSF